MINDTSSIFIWRNLRLSGALHFNSDYWYWQSCLQVVRSGYLWWPTSIFDSLLNRQEWSSFLLHNHDQTKHGSKSFSHLVYITNLHTNKALLLLDSYKNKILFCCVYFVRISEVRFQLSEQESCHANFAYIPI